VGVIAPWASISEEHITSILRWKGTPKKRLAKGDCSLILGKLLSSFIRRLEAERGSETLLLQQVTVASKYKGTRRMEFK
jgi:hypothetical protein